jgi:hypothetical protein
MNPTINTAEEPTAISKSEITQKIVSDKNFKTILKTYKTDLTQGFAVSFSDGYKNGLADSIYGITMDDKLISLLVPIFSTEKTITWNNSYLKTIRSVLPNEYQNLEDHEIVALVKTPLYYYDKWTNDVQFLSLVNLTDWINNGMKGKNGYSVYFWNDKLPNKWSLDKKQLSGEVFVATLPKLSNKELKNICTEYATAYHKRFADVSLRSDLTKIKNIALGLYAQIKTYLWMLNNGYDVSMEWNDGDDLGIDITYRVNGMEINIDVKSTKTDLLKISKNRKETHFYAVCNWNKSEPQLLGLLFKHNFWKSDVINTTAPEKKNEMYTKTLKQIAPDLIDMDMTFNVLHNYNILRMKRGQRLFNAE